MLWLQVLEQLLRLVPDVKRVFVIVRSRPDKNESGAFRKFGANHENLGLEVDDHECGKLISWTYRGYSSSGRFTSKTDCVCVCEVTVWGVAQLRIGCRRCTNAPCSTCCARTASWRQLCKPRSRSWRCMPSKPCTELCPLQLALDSRVRYRLDADEPPNVGRIALCYTVTGWKRCSCACRAICC